LSSVMVVTVTGSMGCRVKTNGLVDYFQFDFEPNER